MKLGIVGTGTIVEEVLPVLQQVKGLSCYGICGTKRSEAKAEKLKEQYQMQLAVSDYEKLLDSEIDTVYIAVPNLLHFEMAKEAVLRGKHVIVEKPMTANERQPEYRIEGSEGYIVQNSPCNVCGAVTIHYRDGREVSYDGNGDAHRMYAEFVSFVNEIASKDTAACYEMLDHSIAVSRILTRARADAGIVFPCDEN